MSSEARTTVTKHLRLTHDGALMIIDAAVAKAAAMGVPQCIAVVDDGGNLLAFLRMDGAKFLSTDSATRKAISAVSSRAPPRGTAAEGQVRPASPPSSQLSQPQSRA